jgi:hypothetical protein
VAWEAQKMGGKTRGSYWFCSSLWRFGSNVFSWLGGELWRKMGRFLYFLIVWVLVLFLWLVFHSFYFKEGVKKLALVGIDVGTKWV